MLLRLVRHGESEGNFAGTLQGSRIDPGLTARGRRQAESLAIRLAGEDIDLVVTSPMRRARETADLVAAPHGVPMSVDAELVEFDWGTWTGRPFDAEMERQVGELRARWRAGETGAPAPGGETPILAAERLGRVLERLKSRGALAPLVIAHGRVNRILMSLVLGRDISRMDEIRQRNGSLSAFDWDGGGNASPLLLDDVSHLDGDLAAQQPWGESLR